MTGAGAIDIIIFHCLFYARFMMGRCDLYVFFTITTCCRWSLTKQMKWKADVVIRPYSTVKDYTTNTYECSFLVLEHII